LQIGLAMLAPLFLLFIVGSPVGLNLLARRYALAITIGALIAAPFLVPFMHFYPSFGKFTNPEFGTTQPFAYILLNLVISDLDFYRGDSLGTLPYPYLYVNYIGWIAVGFAALGCYALWRAHRTKLVVFLLSWTIGAMWISSAMLLAWIRDLTSPGNPLHELVIGMRHPSLIAGLAIPSVLALSATGVDYLIKHRPHGIHAKLWFNSVTATRIMRFDPRWLLVIPLALALRSEQRFAANFLTLSRQPIETMAPVLDALATTDVQWVSPPFGEEYWIGQLAERNLKWGTFGRVWHWKGRPDPTPVFEASRKGPPEGMIHVATVADIGIYAPPPGSEYAAVTHTDGTRTVCTASAVGGNIDVTCDLTQPGRVEVKEK
jgi:hypothetical protein